MITIPDRPQILKHDVSGWFSSAIHRILFPKKEDKSHIKYKISDPDEYDKEYGLTVELGVYTVEEYYFIKGWHFGQKAFELLHSNN